MIFADFINQFATPKFAIASLGEYAERRAKYLTNLINCVNDAVGQDQLIPDVDAFIIAHGIENPSAQISIDGSLYSVKTLVSNANLFRDDVEDELSITSMMSPPTVGTSKSFAECFDSITSALHSVVSLSAACKAQAEDLVASKLNVYRDRVQTTFKNAYSDISNSSSYYRQLLSAKLDDATFISTLITDTNVEQLAEDENPDPSNSIIAEYTGANPVNALAFAAAAGKIGEVFKGGIKIVGNFMKGMLSVVKSGVKWLVKKVETGTINPDDLLLVNKDGANSIDGFYFQPLDPELGRSRTFTINQGLYDELAPFLTSSGFDSKLNKWIKFEFIFGEALIRFRRKPEVNPSGSFGPELTFDLVDVAFKPYIINPDVVSAANAFASEQHPASSAERWFSYIQYLTTHDLSVDGNADEKVKAAGLATGLRLFHDVLFQAQHVATTTEPVSSDWSAPSEAVAASSFANGITNADFLHMACGLNDRPASLPGTGIVPSTDSIRYAMDYLIALTIYNFCNEWNYPLDYPWFAYSNNITDFHPSAWRIQTDAENQETFVRFMVVAYVIVLAVAAAIFIGITSAKIAKSIFFKRTEFVSRMQNKMWQGGTLTAAEKRKYVRYSRRLEASNYLSSQLQPAPGTNGVTINSSDTSGSISQIVALITG